MKDALFLNNEEITYQAPPVKKTGMIRHSPSFTIRLAEIKIVAYVPRIVVDDESGFLVFVTTSGSINYFSLDVANEATVAKLKSIFNIKLNELPNTPFEEINWHSFIVYPQELAQHTLFKPWSWLTLRGFSKNLGKALSLDNPMWEQLTDEAQAYLAKNF